MDRRVLICYATFNNTPPDTRKNPYVSGGGFNVLATVTDKKIYYDADNDGDADYSIPEIASEQDYYPFGMPMPGRSLSLSNYRFGFNGQEKMDEISGTGNHSTAEFWEYDTRLGRRWNIDPIIKPWESPYATFSNDPIYFSDPTGLDSDNPPVANPSQDANGGAGSTAPNGGTHNSGGGVVGGKGYCAKCGENGEDIYGLPDQKSGSSPSTEKPKSDQADASPKDNTDVNNNRKPFDVGVNGKYPGEVAKFLGGLDYFLQGHHKFEPSGNSFFGFGGFEFFRKGSGGNGNIANLTKYGVIKIDYNLIESASALTDFLESLNGLPSGQDVILGRQDQTQDGEQGQTRLSEPTVRSVHDSVIMSFASEFIGTKEIKSVDMVVFDNNGGFGGMRKANKSDYLKFPVKK